MSSDPEEENPKGTKRTRKTKKEVESTAKAPGQEQAIEQPRAVEPPNAVEVVPVPEPPEGAAPTADAIKPAAEEPVAEPPQPVEPPQAVSPAEAVEPPAKKAAGETKKVETKKPETKKTETKTPASALKAPVEKKAPKPTFAASLRSVVLLLLETILPVTLAGVVTWYAFGYFNFWQYNRTAMLALFAVVLVALTLLLSIVFDTLTGPLRKSSRKQGLRFYSDPRTRVVKVGLGGLLLPLVVFAAANLVTLPGRGTAMNLIISSSAPVVKLTPSDAVGRLALESGNPETKQLSIQVLQGQRSPEGLSQLIRLLNEDPAGLQDAGVAGALAQAIASYGLQAKDPLLVAFKSVEPGQAGSSVLSGDLYDRYFSRSFTSLQAEVSAGTVDAAQRAARLAQLQAAEAQLKTTLAGMSSPDGATTSESAPGDPRAGFVLRVFLAMDVQQEPELLALAKATAADRRYAGPVRGDALLLVGKLGGKDELNLLFPYLKENDALIQARALQAIAALQDKLSKAPASNP